MNRRSLIPRSLLSLLAISTLAGTIGCSSAALPPAVTEADALLRRQTDSVEAARPQLIAEARDLLERAKAAAGLGDNEKATLLARQSIQKVQSAKNFTERERAERMQRALNKSKGGTGIDAKRLKAIEDRVSKLETGEQAGGAAALRARRAITKARQAQLAASQEDPSASSPQFTQGQSQLESALDSYESKAYAEAGDAAQSASAAFAAALALNSAKPKAEAPAAVAERSAPTRPMPPAPAGSSNDLRSLSERTIVALQFKRGESLGQMKDRSCTGPFREFESLLELAQKRFDVNDYDRAYEFAVRADERFRACDAQAASSVAGASAALAANNKKEADEEAARRKASAQIQKAQVELARVQAIAPQDAAVVQGVTLLGNADTWYAKSAYGEATDLATRAFTVLAKVTGGGAKTTTNAAGETVVKAGAATKEDAEDALADATDARGKAPDGVAKTRAALLITEAERAFARKAYDETVTKAQRATEALRAAIKDATCAEAKTFVAEARTFDKKLSATKLEEWDAKSRREALTELASVDRKVQKKECEEALISATTARDVLASMVGEAPAPVKATVALADGKTPPAGSSKPKADGKPFQASLEAIQKAETAQRDAQLRASGDGDKANLAVGERALGEARTAYEKDDFTRAETRAKDARAAFEAVRGGGKPAAAVAATTQPAGKPAPAASNPQAYAQERVQQLEAQGTYANVDPSWKGAYAKVFSALALRDEAAAAAPKEKAKLASADAKIASARGAWNKKLYPQAQGFAESAIQILEPLVGSPDEGSTEELELARIKADAAMREAAQLATVCDKERCSERNSKQFAESKALQDSAKRAYDGKRWKIAAEYGNQARDGFDAVLKTPLKDARDPQMEAAKLKELQLAADDAIRDANIAKKICDTKGCKDRDRDGSMIRAVEMMASANVAYTDKRFDVARDRAREVESLYKAALASVPTFEVNDKAVTRSGDQLVPTPKITFTNAKSTLTPASAGAVDALAKVILANKDAIKRVNLIGYTDNKGAAASNQKLSAARAGALKAALSSRGVPADLLTADGRGIENPIADNSSAAGRETNRRVEIHVELKDGVQ